MDPLSIAALGGVALSAIGTATSIFGSSQAAEANRESIAAQSEMEDARHRAMLIDADRRRRNAIRQGIIMRSQALASGTSAGAAGAGSSALPGSFGQIAGETSWTLTGINNQVQLGEELFSANKKLLAAKMKGADAQQTQQLGQGLSSFGGALVNNYERLDRVFGSAPNLGSTAGKLGSGVSTPTFSSGTGFGVPTWTNPRGSF